MSEWKKVKLKEVSLTIQPGPFGTQLHNSDYTNYGIPVIMPRDMIDGRVLHERLEYVSEETANRISRHKVYAGDIIVARKGDVRKCIFIRESENGWITGSDCIKMQLNNTLCNSLYIYYQLRSPYIGAWLQKVSKGATMPSLNTSLLGDIEIGLPPLPTQHRIATILSRYDSLIENYQKQIKLLEEAAQRLYKEWFVDLHFPGHENTKIVDGVPEGWKKKSVTDVLEIKYGKDHKLLKDGTNPVYGTGGVMRYVEKSLCTGESVLIPRKGSLNNILLVDGTFWTIDTMFYSIPKEDNVAKIVYFYLKGVDMYSFNIGAAVPSMTINILSGMKLLIPKDDIRKEFEKIVSIYFIRVQSLQSQIRLLTEARDRLLPKLMSGEIEI